MVFFVKFFWSLLRHIHSPEDRSPASSSPYPKTMRCSEGLFTCTMGVPCNPEMGKGVGLLATIDQPASSFLHVITSKTISTDIRYILAVRDGGCYGSTVEGISTSRVVHKICRLCSHRLDGRTIYMYRGLMFCTRGCRFDYFMAALYEERHREHIGTPPERISVDVKAWLVPAEEVMSFRKIFSWPADEHGLNHASKASGGSSNATARGAWSQ